MPQGNARYKLTDWLPVSAKEAAKRGWAEFDVIIISGDAYVDHPAFGHAVIGRIIEHEGFRVGIVPQPNWRDDLRDFRKLGKPRLFFGVTSGCMDSMVNHYTANRRLRSDDAYTPGGMAGFRPDYAVTVYTRILKRLYPDVPVVIGGIEASMRRFTHYDYWSDTLKPSILIDSGADMLVYGMGERPVLEILRLLRRGVPASSLTTIPQTAILLPEDTIPPKNRKWKTLELAPHETCLRDERFFAENFRLIETESNKTFAKRLIQRYCNKIVVVNPPYPAMTEKEIDGSFDLPYMRLPHPRYDKKGVIPAMEMIKFSINTHRGCFGGCSFCTISAHQGKNISSRSEGSILREVEAITGMADFKGYISDLGGPSANMYRMEGIERLVCDRCARPSCIYPKICSNLNTSHKSLLSVYRKVAAHPKVKKAFVSSGIRYDLLIGRAAEETEKNGCNEYMEQLIRNHVSGRLKVAPEHTSDTVLKVMRKPSFALFNKFKDVFNAVCEKSGLKQQMIPYFISSHPGCRPEDMAELAVKTKEMGYRLEQVQDFTPTPMTLATVIYYSGYHPYTMGSVYSAKSGKEKIEQRRFFFWHRKENRNWIRRKLQLAGRKDLAMRLFATRTTYGLKEKLSAKKRKESTKTL